MYTLKSSHIWAKISLLALIICALPQAQASAQLLIDHIQPDANGDITLPLAQYEHLVGTTQHYEKFFSLMTFWLGVPYQRGGTTPSGVDCSGFTYALCRDMYGVKLPRTSQEQYNSVDLIDKSLLGQGDLVFFSGNVDSLGVSHVGVYLGNGKFMHASTSGVKIDNLDSTYYRTRYVGGGKVKYALEKK
jgi:cell wall-associated NlpC family hydrolase